MKRRVYGPKSTPSKKRTKKRTSYSTPARFASPRTSVPSSISGVGTVVKAKLIYVEKDVTINPGLGTAGTYLFNLSSLFDPNFTGVGHQPTGFDQFMAMYEQYLVVGAQITVAYQNAASASTSGLVVGITLNDTSTTSTDCRQYMENGNTVWDVTTGLPDSHGMTILKQYVSMPQFHGVTLNQYLSDDNYKGTSSASPVESVWATIWAQDITVAGDPPGCNIIVEIDFDVRFTGGKLNSLS